ncbi:hypothetical protein GCM10011349_47400 [Novosphingobium indicum]|uniref:Uncharacterized protein n=1 Tax=Novosphingobium indicum TaxID=462949 RepID=A0ABQ2K2T4_9SPHN|nr:hypothetical protein GCM10011349_47400 [Novosphingobium indicum]
MFFQRVTSNDLNNGELLFIRGGSLCISVPVECLPIRNRKLHKAHINTPDPSVMSVNSLTEGLKPYERPF